MSDRENQMVTISLAALEALRDGDVEVCQWCDVWIATHEHKDGCVICDVGENCLHDMDDEEAFECHEAENVAHAREINAAINHALAWGAR